MKAAAITHVRHDDFYLDIQARHYAGLIGAENLFVLFDGDAWTRRARFWHNAAALRSVAIP